MDGMPGTSRPTAVSNATLMDAIWDSLAGFYGDFTSAAADEGLTSSQAKTLTVLRRGPASMRSLATTLHCDASNVTGIIDRLEARALVRREPSATDRRVKNVVLTDEGIRTVETIRTGMLATHGALDALPDADRVALHDLLQRLFATPERGPGTPG
ncbi:MarR family transcriptional regulator [Streptomyces violascens]|uniref:MarR family transcriptional regulator n=2 Tax=Streptomyces violascens TaxID=67381 RepID=A0ABQ3QQP9_9ACTN|nr:MarR family transcriptional regulator [Streptomyces violascens]GHI39597.1 MarR family transcriptional regulator [Streptomyces violascens]